MTSRPAIALEICADSLASSLSAERGGADRIELCSDLAEGGITPSAGLIEIVRSRVSIALHVLVRPRAGNFCYSDEEFETMRRDIVVAKNLGANGVASGVLDASGNIDVKRTRELVELARPLSFTFHRAFDLAADLPRAFDDVYACGADRLLTSGGAPTAVAGADVIARLVQMAAGKLIVMACGGIHGQNAAQIVNRTGAKEIHAGLRTPLPDSSSGFSRIQLGTAPEATRFEVREESVVQLRRAVSSAGR